MMRISDSEALKKNTARTFIRGKSLIFLAKAYVGEVEFLCQTAHYERIFLRFSLYVSNKSEVFILP